MYTDSQNKVVEDIRESNKAIIKLKNTILPRLISGRIISVESQEDEVKKLLDIEAGIDYLRYDKHGLQGIASRIQYKYTANTFTIRTERESGNKTELEKRLYAIENDYLYPEFTLQAYFDNSIDLNLYSVAIIKTVDLFNYYKTNEDDFGKSASNAKFIYIHWEKLRHLQIKIYKEYEKEKYNEEPF